LAEPANDWTAQSQNIIMRRALVLIAVLCTTRITHQATLISATNEVQTQTNLQELCPNAANDQRIIGDFNLAAYRRQPVVEVARHKRSLDQVLGRLLPEQVPTPPKYTHTYAPSHMSPSI